MNKEESGPVPTYTLPTADLPSTGPLSGRRVWVMSTYLVAHGPTGFGKIDGRPVGTTGTLLGYDGEWGVVETDDGKHVLIPMKVLGVERRATVRSPGVGRESGKMWVVNDENGKVFAMFQLHYHANAFTQENGGEITREAVQSLVPGKDCLYLPKRIPVTPILQVKGVTPTLSAELLQTRA